MDQFWDRGSGTMTALNGLIAAIKKRKKRKKREEGQEERVRKLENEVEKYKKARTEQLIQFFS